MHAAAIIATDVHATQKLQKESFALFTPYCAPAIRGSVLSRDPAYIFLQSPSPSNAAAARSTVASS